MYLDAMEFLEEEREAWREFEALADLSDEQAERPVADAHGWSGRDLMVHMLGWLDVSLQAAKELAVREDSPTIASVDEEWDRRGGEAVNADLIKSSAGRSTAEVRERFATVAGELRGYLTVVPEIRWVKHSRYVRWFVENTIEHYEEHRADLAAILAASRS
jgi:hypothetical protein